MIERLHVPNFRCLENFTLDLKGHGSALVIGKNGAGKSTLRQALGVFQKIGRGPNRVKDWIEASDFTRGRREVPMRFELDATLKGQRFQYAISFDMPDRFREPRVESESLVVDGEMIFSRHHSQVDLPGGSPFGLDWHVAALPVVTRGRTGGEQIQQLRAYLAATILIAPIPARMSGFSEQDEDQLDEHAENIAAWLNALLIRRPAAYSVIDAYLREVIPDFESFENVPRGEQGTQLTVRFKRPDSDETLAVEFKRLSDGEKCFILSAVIVAYNQLAEPVFCFWDEPDNHLSLPEVSHFITQLRRLTVKQGQFIATSHHPETIRRFSDENTFVFIRNSHLEPTVVRPLDQLEYTGDLIQALIRNEVIG